MAAALSWALPHAEGSVTQSIRSVFTAAIQEFATHTLLRATLFRDSISKRIGNSRVRRER